MGVIYLPPLNRDFQSTIVCRLSRDTDHNLLPFPYSITEGSSHAINIHFTSLPPSGPEQFLDGPSFQMHFSLATKLPDSELLWLRVQYMVFKQMAMGVCRITFPAVSLCLRYAL